MPGVSSIAAVPAAAGIPVTHRGVSDRVTIASCQGADGSEAEYARLAAIGGTLILFMGLGRVERVVDGLLAAGLPPDTPAAAVSRGTLPDQEVVRATLARLAAATTGLASPALLVIGDVARRLSCWRPSSRAARARPRRPSPTRGARPVLGRSTRETRGRPPRIGCRSHRFVREKELADSRSRTPPRARAPARFPRARGRVLQKAGCSAAHRRARTPPRLLASPPKRVITSASGSRSTNPSPENAIRELERAPVDLHRRRPTAEPRRCSFITASTETSARRSDSPTRARSSRARLVRERDRARHLGGRSVIVTGTPAAAERGHGFGVEVGDAARLEPDPLDRRREPSARRQRGG